MVLPHHDTKPEPMHFDLDVTWRLKTYFFLRNHFLGPADPYNYQSLLTIGPFFVSRQGIMTYRVMRYKCD